MKIKKVLRLLRLLIAVLFALFFAGIAAQSFLRSELDRNYTLASGSLHTLTIAHIAFTYTFWNLASALLGALFGAIVVLLGGSRLVSVPSLALAMHSSKCAGNRSSSAKPVGPASSEAI